MDLINRHNKRNKIKDLQRIRDKKLGIYENKVIVDDEGYEEKEYVLVREVWGSVRNIKGREFYEADQTNNLDIKTFNFDYFPNLSHDSYIKYNEEYYNIEHVDNINNNNFEYEIKARLVKSSE